MVTMRAKFYVSKVTPGGPNYESLEFSAVTRHDGPYGPNGENEDNDFARYTPSGTLKMSVTNPNLVGQFKQDDAFYIDFTPVESGQ